MLRKLVRHLILRRRQPLTRAAVGVALAEHGITADTIVLGADGASALAWSDATGDLAFVDRHGKGNRVRPIHPGDLAGITLNGPGHRLTLNFANGPAPRAGIGFADASELEKWRRVLMLYGELPNR